MATLHDLARFIEQNPDLCDVGKPVSEDLIEKAAQYLQVRFPNDYREFLKR
jgi:hypothetical protein